MWMPRNHKGLVLMLGVALVLGGVLTAAAPGKQNAEQNGVESLRKTSQAFTQIAKQATPAVVFIKVEKSVEVSPQSFGPEPFGFGNPFNPFDEDFMDRFFRRRTPQRQQPQQRPQRKFRQQGQGSGFIVTADGYILTNHHVVGEADEILVKMNDGRELKAKLVGSDPKSDVAVIKVEGKDFPTIAQGDSSKLEIGEWVVAIGNPFGLTATLTVGVVSAKGRSAVGIADYEDFIQTDAAINPGNSGGPLLNLNGEVVGINTAIFSRSGGYMGIGFAIPMNLAKGIMDQLVKTGKVTRGFLGVVIQDVNKDLAEQFKLTQTEGVLVSEIIKDSPAEKAGLKPGDVILTLNGQPSKDVGTLRNNVALIPPGQDAKLKVLREGKEVEVTVKIGTLPDNIGEAGGSELAEKLGLKVQALTEELAAQFGYKMGEGVLVAEVAPGSPAANAQIRPGALILSVNRQPVASMAAFNEALKKSAESKKALLLIKQEQYSRFVVLPVE
ncbi:MAG TPA: DegQ family serine endoprotease [Candidatus Brocadiia bacterium]|nr:DegQ family serine endoprotease [Candidatus Brocadiia bacterium]